MTDLIRVQPPPVEVPCDEPFKNDLLGRRTFAEALAATFGGAKGPGVFAIDGQWGTGKTTFVRMFKQHLLNEGLQVTTINAWDTDYADEPLAALVSSVANAGADDAKRRDFKKAAVGVLKVVAPAAIRAATYGMLDLGTAVEKSAGDALSKFAENGLARFEEHSKSMGAFKQRLKDLATQDGDKPMVVIVDELDRCRPTYAVEMLETIKHAFDVDNLLFVLAVNRKQLDQSAATLYGTSLDPESYFRRFFDFELRLPDPDREALVRELLRTQGVPHQGFDADMLAEFLARSPFGIRTLGGTIHHYALAYASLNGFNRETWSWALPSVILWRLVDEELYRAFLYQDMPDDQFIDSIFDFEWIKPLRGTHSANVVEAAAIAVRAWSPMGDRQSSPLLERHEASHEENTRSIPDLYKQMRRNSQMLGWCFPTIVERVEMLQIVDSQKP